MSWMLTWCFLSAACAEEQPGRAWSHHQAAAGRAAPAGSQTRSAEETSAKSDPKRGAKGNVRRKNEGNSTTIDSFKLKHNSYRFSHHANCRLLLQSANSVTAPPPLVRGSVSSNKGPLQVSAVFWGAFTHKTTFGGTTVLFLYICICMLLYELKNVCSGVQPKLRNSDSSSSGTRWDAGLQTRLHSSHAAFSQRLTGMYCVP